MNRITRRKTRISMTVMGYKNGKQILRSTMRIPRGFIRRIEASTATAFKIKVRYGNAKTSSEHIEEIVNEVEGSKKECLRAVKCWLSAHELDFTEHYWKFV